MLLCSYSSKFALDGYTVLDNQFLNEFLPQATGDAVKVYLYGLGLCSKQSEEENNLDTISKVLSMTEDQILDCFMYWQEVGLVQVVSSHPLEIKYLPVKMVSGSSKLRKKEKYSDFNKQMQEVISGRMLTPVELNEYYTLIEVYHFEPEAVVLIAKYCTSLKSNSIGYPYILAVARSFAADGLMTFQKVEEKFLEQERSSAEIKQVLLALGIKREADLDERNCYIKWTQRFGFTQGTIVEVAKSLKKRGGIFKLDEVLTKYYEQHLISNEEIANFSKQRDEYFDIAKTVSKNLGLYYQDYEVVVTTYVMDWISKGYDKETLDFLSSYCFKQSIRTLEGFNTTIQKMFKLGLITLPAIKQYIGGVLETDENIKEILAAVGLVRGVTSFDRESYKMWTENWGYDHNQILLVAKNFAGKASALSYISRVLASLHEQNIHDTNLILSRIKTTSASDKSAAKSAHDAYETRNYSREELNAVFDSLDDVEV